MSWEGEDLESHDQMDSIRYSEERGLMKQRLCMKFVEAGIVYKGEKYGEI